MQHQSPVLTKSEAAKYLRCSESTIDRLRKRELLKFKQHGRGKVSFRKEWLDAYLDRETA
jgi:excisionase family DNA binding protein